MRRLRVLRGWSGAPRYAGVIAGAPQLDTLQSLALNAGRVALRDVARLAPGLESLELVDWPASLGRGLPFPGPRLGGLAARGTAGPAARTPTHAMTWTGF